MCWVALDLAYYISARLFRRGLGLFTIADEHDADLDEEKLLHISLSVLCQHSHKWRLTHYTQSGIARVVSPTLCYCGSAKWGKTTRPLPVADYIPVLTV